MKSGFALKKAVRGFTLIELMIVVVVIAVLAAIAYPSYQEYVRKARRTQAKADIVEYMQLAERYHTVNNTYVGFTLEAQHQRSPREGGTAWYTIAINPAATANAIRLVATVSASTAQANDKCGNLSITQAGAKGNTKGSTADCW